MKVLVLGGARSGKSRYAEQLARGRGRSLRYIATGEAKDVEMARRIHHHQQQRASDWRVHEEALQLGSALAECDAADSCILVDCLTLWLSNCLAERCWPEQRELFLQTLPTMAADVILVSNEVGSGVVPLGELSREFVDASGWLHQELTQHCDSVTLVVAGLPLYLKGKAP
ncbi:MAG: bifunctional adenosylcobinamide kinase/adenosylcobinamide-phosphate guanylyltransferase [Gammaproteobacteria bacterium]|nr:bifunctional adenosylcobinamide kinase/adenosylcobinamide-phosphate guanylyltransferase [Gammaproteobacteria bacterium]